jgi:hypothetical protein
MGFEQFSEKFASLDQLSEPFGSALAKCLGQREQLRTVVFGPSFKTMGQRRPATVLVVTDQQWLVASDDERGGVGTVAASFQDSVLLELVDILLAGHLRIDFGAEHGQLNSVAIDFNTVMIDYYRQAIDLILEGIEGSAGKSRFQFPDEERFRDWPMKFRNAAINHIPQCSEFVDAVCWPPTIGGFQRELAPAACLIVTTRELVLISDERAHWWMRATNQTKLGTIVTYCPLQRLTGFRLQHQPRLALLDLQTQAGHGTETLHIAMPADCTQEVRRIIERVSYPLPVG